MASLRRLLPYLRRRQGVLAKGLACLFATTALSMASPWILRRAIDDLTLLLSQEKLVFYAAAILALVVLEGVFRYLMRMTLVGLSRDLEYELRNDLFSHFTLLEPRYYHVNRIGDLMSRASSDLSAVRMVLGPGIMYTANTLATAVAAVALMARLSPPLCGVALVPLVLVSILMRRYGRQIHDRFERVQEQLAALSTRVQENLSGARVVRAYVQESYEQQRFDEANDEYVERNRRLILLYGALYPGIQLLMGLGAVVVLLLGGHLVVSSQLTLGDFVAFSAYLTMLHWPMIAVGWVINLFERGEASMGRILQILDTPPGIRDEKPRPVAALRGAVEFRRLSFAYNGASVLHDIDLKVASGQTVAILGPTGSGKSTLVSLLARLYDPPPGSLFIDGVDVRELPLAIVRRSVGFVPQEPFLFSDTIRNNLGFGLESQANGRVEWAAEIAQLAKDVAAFPEGYETAVGERGITLSGGQKQRATLARALAIDPRILVLDDALSSVDTQTEEDILRGLREVMRSRTTFLVSHRVSTVKDADLIVVLHQGRIVERGTHDELEGRGGYYAELNRRQQLEEEVETVS